MNPPPNHSLDKRAKANARNRAYKLRNREKLRLSGRAYYHANREKISAYSREHYLANKERCFIYTKAWRKANPDKVLEISRRAYLRRKDGEDHKRKAIDRAKRWYLKNKARAIESARIRINHRNQTDPIFRLKGVLRARVREALKFSQGRAVKAARTSELIGCSVEDLRAYLENQFCPGMTWDNHGRYGWHIDHKKPCASFDLTNPAEQKICFHFSNLQPLWAKDNLSKGSRYE